MHRTDPDDLVRADHGHPNQPGHFAGREDHPVRSPGRSLCRPPRRRHRHADHERHGAIDGQPVFSPDGERILFVSDRSGNENLWIMSADGSNLTALTKERGDLDFESPEWSPDGEYVLVRK